MEDFPVSFRRKSRPQPAFCLTPILKLYLSWDLPEHSHGSPTVQYLTATAQYRCVPHQFYGVYVPALPSQINDKNQEPELS